MPFYRKVLFALVGLVALGALAYVNRLPILLRLTGMITDYRNPRAPNQPIAWNTGPDVAAQPGAPRPPNIIVILADDLGFNGVTTYGPGLRDIGVPTPAIDSIARDGVRFDQGFAANAVCSPSRAGLLTGRYASRFGFEFTPTPGSMARLAPMLEDKTRLRQTVTHPEVIDQIPPSETMGMPPSEITLAELLKERGYHTVHIGKWHVGGTPAMRPNNQGFDESLFMESGLYLPVDSPDTVNAKQDKFPNNQFLWANLRYAASYNGGKWFEPKGYLTDYYSEEAVKVIKANKNRPFFLYLAHWAVHTPMQALKSDYDALANIPDHTRRVYAAMVRSLDRGVGQVLQALKDEGLDENTIVIFTSDNGAPHTNELPELNLPYRGWKLTLFDGGIRVPMAMKWPGHIPAGSTYQQPVISLDFLPTVAAATGASVPADRPIDGVNLLPYLAGGGGPVQPARPIFWTDGSYQAVLFDGWKMQVAARPAKTWLYNVAADPGERINLADKEPAKLAELKALLAAHQKEMSPPMWPSFIEAPVSIDKTYDQPDEPGDEYVYWQN